MSTSERKSFCIESLLSREGVVGGGGGGGRGTLSPADLTSHEVTSPPHTPPLSPLSSPHSSPLSVSPAVSSSSAMLNRASLLGGAAAPLMPPHLYQYPGMGMPPALLPAHAFAPTNSPLLDAQALSALKSGAAALPPAALEWFSRAGLMYPRLPPELTGATENKENNELADETLIIYLQLKLLQKDFGAMRRPIPKDAHYPPEALLSLGRRRHEFFFQVDAVFSLQMQLLCDYKTFYSLSALVGIRDGPPKKTYNK